MKAITSHRLRNGFSLFFTILILITLIVFGNNFIKAFTSTKTPPTMVIIFLIGILISTGVMIYTYIIELLKSEKKLKEERVNTLKNRIDFYNKEISEIEKEIEKLS